MPNTSPDNLRYPNGPTKVGRLWQHFKNLADDVQLAINSLTNQHIEWTVVKTSMPAAQVLGIGLFTVDPAATTNPNMATYVSDGRIRVAAPGLYALSTLTFFVGQPATNRVFAELSTNSGDTGLLQRTSMPVGEDRVSLSLANLRITQPDQDLYFRIYNQASTTTRAETRVRLTKVGRL